VNLPSRRSRLGCIAFAATAGVAAGVVSIFFISAWQNRDPSPEFTRAEFEAAQRRWERSGPPDYDIAVEVVGRQPAVYRVEVRGGEVTSATIDGRPLKQRRTWSTWSVPGMFATMETDVSNRERFTSGKGDRFTPNLTLRAAFHPTYGYPQRYRRIEWETDRDMIWEVKDFRIYD
jgi:hypothetical protein